MLTLDDTRLIHSGAVQKCSLSRIKCGVSAPDLRARRHARTASTVVGRYWPPGRLLRGALFSGSLDRLLRAYSSETGKKSVGFQHGPRPRNRQWRSRSRWFSEWAGCGCSRWNCLRQLRIHQVWRNTRQRPSCLLCEQTVSGRQLG